MSDPFPDITLDLWRVWRTDKRWRLVNATNERQALRKVRHSVKATLLDDRRRTP